MGGWDKAFLKKAFNFRSDIWERDWSPLTFIHSSTQQIFTEHQLSFPDSSVGKVSTCNAGDPGSIPGSAGEGIGYPLQYSWASLVAQLVKNPPTMRVDLGLIPGLGRSPGEGKGYPLWYSGLENSTDCIVHGVAKSQTWLGGFHFHFSTMFQECFRCWR